MDIPSAYKMTGTLIHNSDARKGKTSDRDAGETISSSDSPIIRHKMKKTQKSMKDHSTRSKIVQNSFYNHHTTNKADTIRGIKTVSSHTTLPPPFFIRETSKRNNGITKEKIRVKNLSKFLVEKRKTVNQKAADAVSKETKKPEVSDFKDKSCFFDNVLNSWGKTQTRFDSLTDFLKNTNTDGVFPQSSYMRNALSMTPSETLVFNKVNSVHHKNNFDYLKEFDLIRYGSGSKKCMKLPKNEDIFSLVPKISPSVPIIVPRRKYSHSVLSVRVASETKEDQTDTNETTMKINFEKTGAFCSSGDLENKHNLRDSAHLDDTWFVNDKNYVLDAKKPLRVKCTDEVTNEIRNIIIYSDDFLKSILTEKGNLTKRETYEIIRNESTDYRGKKLRIIIDAEGYCCSLNNCRKSPRGIKSATVKISKQIPSKFSRHATQTKKYSRNRFCNENSKIYNSTGQRKEEKNTEQKVSLTTKISNETTGNESVDENFTQADECSVVVKNKNSKRMQILQRENEKFKSNNEMKSRTTLKELSIESILESNFSHYFRFYAKLGRPVKCGAAISKRNSTKWLNKSGIVCDRASKSIAENCFITRAGAKYVLNVYDYIKFLNEIARIRQMLLVEMLYQMMDVNLHAELMSKKKQESNRREEPTAQDSPPETKTKRMPRKSKIGAKHP